MMYFLLKGDFFFWLCSSNFLIKFNLGKQNKRI